ncbi:MAG TPA: hypothetical protein VHK63_05870 [Candidatus Limnocylindria bacterium]|nr:hypothetical protein [Candidatus Limnocylindria bacterium]
MDARGRLLAIGLAGALVLVAGLVLLLVRDDEEAAPAGADASAARFSAGPTTQSGNASPSPTNGGPQEVAAEFGRIEREVVALRGLEPPEIEPAEIITRRQLARELEELLDAEWTDEELRRSNLTLRAMGLLEPGQDLRRLSEQLLAGQVIGFYDPAEKRMVVVSDEGLSVTARITYAHEYTHALQDAAFDTFEEREALTDDDAILARQALEEGDAVAVMYEWGISHLSPAELFEVGAQPVPDMTGIPDWMLQQLLFPYETGWAFVQALRAEAGWPAVDDAYTDVPASTEQVIHPDKYATGEEPIEVAAPTTAASLGVGWEDLDATTMGEAMIAIWLEELGVQPSSADPAAAGWGGDRLSVAAGPDDELLMAWRIAWDGPSDADEFADAAAALQPRAGLSATLLRPSATETLVLHATSDELLAAGARLFGG